MKPGNQSMTFDAADGSYYKGLIKSYAVNNEVWVEQVDEDKYRFSWFGISWNDIVNIEMSKDAEY